MAKIILTLAITFVYFVTRFGSAANISYRSNSLNIRFNATDERDTENDIWSSNPGGNSVPTVKTQQKAADWNNVVINTLESESMVYLLQGATIIHISSALQGSASTECRNASKAFLNDLRNGEDWALKMFDASGRPMSGTLEGSLSWLGSFTECQQLVLPKTITRQFSNENVMVRGNYCLMKADILKLISRSNFTSKIINELKELDHELFDTLSLWIAICVPSSCTKDDVRQALNKTDIQATLESCHVKEPTMLTAGAIVVICLCILTVLIVLLGTSIDIYNVKSENSNDQSKLTRSLLAFSLYTNCKSILNTDQSKDTLSSLHGLRLFSIIWIVVLHTYAFTPYQAYERVKYMKEKTIDNPWFDPLRTAGYSVDVFFLLSGLLVCYVFLRQMSKVDAKFNLFKFYFHRWWRLTPVYMMILGITTVFCPLMMSGPFADQALLRFGNCPKNWWTNFLYINNFVNIVSMCVSHSWYLACDMQMYIVSPLILYPLAKWPKIGLAINSIFMVSSMIIPAVLTGVYDYPPVEIVGDPNTTEYFQNIYIKPYCRMVPYCVGIYLGYILHITKRKIEISKCLLVVGWITSTAVALGIIYGLGSIFAERSEASKLMFGRVAYAAFVKLLWALVIGWMIITTTTGNAGIVNSILSWKVLVPFSKLTYCLYLIHPPILYVNTGNMLQSVYFSHYDMVKLFLAVLVISLAVAFVFCVIYELPAMHIEKIFLGPQKKKTKKQETATPGSENEANTSENFDSDPAKKVGSYDNKAFLEDNGSRL